MQYIYFHSFLIFPQNLIVCLNFLQKTTTKTPKISFFLVTYLLQMLHWILHNLKIAFCHSHVSIYLLPSVFLSGYAQTFVSFFRFSLQLDFWLFHTFKLKYVLLTYIVLSVIEQYYKYIPIHYKNLGKFHPNTKNLLFLSLKKFTSGVSSKSGG